MTMKYVATEYRNIMRVTKGRADTCTTGTVHACSGLAEAFRIKSMLQPCIKTNLNITNYPGNRYLVNVYYRYRMQITLHIMTDPVNNHGLIK